MAFVPVAQTVEVRMEFNLGQAEQIVNVLHYLNPDEVAITGNVAEEIGAYIENAWDTILGPVSASEVEMAAVTVKDIATADQPIWRHLAVSAGTAVGDSLPYSTALVATLRTTSGSRGGRGRIFFGGFTEGGGGSGDSAGFALRTAVENFVNEIWSIPSTEADPDTGFLLGVTSREAHEGGDPLGAAIPPVTRGVIGFNVNRRWDTQRRRHNKIRY